MVSFGLAARIRPCTHFAGSLRSPTIVAERSARHRTNRSLGIAMTPLGETTTGKPLDSTVAPMATIDSPPSVILERDPCGRVCVQFRSDALGDRTSPGSDAETHRTAGRPATLRVRAVRTPEGCANRALHLSSWPVGLRSPQSLGNRYSEHPRLCWVMATLESLAVTARSATTRRGCGPPAFPSGALCAMEDGNILPHRAAVARRNRSLDEATEND